MSKKGKDFKIPAPLFSKVFYETLGSVAINEYRKITFDKSNPKMANDSPFPEYSNTGAGVGWRTINGKKVFIDSYANKKKTGNLRRQDKSFANSKAPVLSGDLMLDTQHSASPKENAIYIGWNKDSFKVDHLRKMGRVLTSTSNPINPNVIKKIMPSFEKELMRTMPKGTQTITIGKKK